MCLPASIVLAKGKTQNERPCTPSEVFLQRCRKSGSLSNLPDCLGLLRADFDHGGPIWGQ
jgi:hypothetical protein